MSTQMPEDVRSTVTAEPHAPSQTPAPAPRRPHRRTAAVVAGIAVVATAVTVLWSTSPEQPPRDPAPNPKARRIRRPPASPQRTRSPAGS
jgi:ferric-dicitrate binding protein FerR (iron transport regulator)